MSNILHSSASPSSPPRTPGDLIIPNRPHETSVSSSIASDGFSFEVNVSLLDYRLNVDGTLIEYCSAKRNYDANNTSAADAFLATCRRLQNLEVPDELIDRFEKTYTALQAHQRSVVPLRLNPHMRLNTCDDGIFRKNGNEELCIKDLIHPDKEELFISLYNIHTNCNSPENPTRLLTPKEYNRLITEGYNARISSSSQSQVLLHAPTPPQSRLLNQSQVTGQETSLKLPDTPPSGPGQPFLPPHAPQKEHSVNTFHARKEVIRELAYPEISTSDSDPPSPSTLNHCPFFPAGGPIGSAASHTSSSNGYYSQGSSTPGSPEGIRCSSDTSPLEFKPFRYSATLFATEDSTLLGKIPMSSIPPQQQSYDSDNSCYGELFGFSLDLSYEHTKETPPTAGINGFLETPRHSKTSTEATSNSATLSTFSPNQESTSPADSPGSSSSYHSNTGSTPSNTLVSMGSPVLLNNPLQNLGSPSLETHGTPERIRYSSNIPHMQLHPTFYTNSSFTIHGSPTLDQTTASNRYSQYPSYSEISSDDNHLEAFSVHLSNKPSEHTQKKSPTAGIDGFLKLLFKPLEPITKAVGESQSRASNHQPRPRKLPNCSSVLDRTPRLPIPNPGSQKKRPEEGGLLNWLCGAFAPLANNPRADIRGNVTSAVYV